MKIAQGAERESRESLRQLGDNNMRGLVMALISLHSNLIATRNIKTRRISTLNKKPAEC
jgi:hypothetical protein